MDPLPTFVLNYKYTTFFPFLELCEITGIENISNNQSMISIPPRVNNSNEKLSLSTETYVVKDDDVADVDDLQKSISLNDGTVSEN